MYRSILMAAALASLTAAAQAQTQAPMPLVGATTTASAEAYGRLPSISDAAISPDGRRVALASTTAAGQSRVIVMDLETGHTSGANIPDGGQLRGVDWANDQYVDYVMTQTFQPGQVLPTGVSFNGAPRRVDYFRTGLLDASADTSRILTTNAERAWADQGATLIAPIEGETNTGRMWGRNSDGMISLYTIDLTTGRARGNTPRGSNVDTIGYELDSAGQIYARYDSDERTNRWRIFIYENGNPRLLTEGVSEVGEPDVGIVGLLPDNRIVVSERPDGHDFRSLYIMDRTTGARTPFLSQDGADVSAALHDRWTHRIVGAAWTSDQDHVQYFDPDIQAAYQRITTVFEGDTPQIMAWSRDRTRYLIYAERGLDGGGYYVYDSAANNLRQIGMRYPELRNSPQGERQSITYRARDGVRIPAYLTYPPNVDRHNLPLVLLVHGGPHARDDFSFDWWSAFLASRGYAVLQPEFRGSTGYGHAWEEAGKHQWGGLMQTDTEDGVAALIRNHIVDPTRVCIVGASYGGYAALAGATLTPDRYRCAVSVAGVSDLEQMLLWESRLTGGTHSMTSDFWRLSIGDRAEDRAHLREVSPANLVDRVHIPILLIHGTDDTVVPMEQTQRMLQRLQAAGKDVRFVQLTGDDHWLSDAATRTRMLREVDGFLSANLMVPHVTVDDSGAPVAAQPH